MEPSFYAAHAAVEETGWWHAGRRRVLDAVLAAEWAARDGGARDVLDVGCGTGATTAFLCRGRRVTACDLSPEALAHARALGLAPLVRASGEALPFRDESFDAALALDVLEHHADDARVAREIRRVLRPGGFLLATVPAFPFLWGPHDVLSHHHRRYRLAELVRLAEDAGLTVRLATYFNSLLFPVVALVQLARRALRLGRPPRPADDNPRRMPAAVNALLREAFAVEERWLPRRTLPVGVSALVLASRPGGAA